MTKMIALRDTHYGGRTVKKDEKYEVQDKYVKILVQTSAARVDDGIDPPRPKKYNRRDMRA